MGKITDKSMAEPQTAPVSGKNIVKTARALHKRFTMLLVLGCLSVLLYVGLYLFNTDIVSHARATYQGSKGLFFLPILLALVFSLIHGAFTSKFWDTLGVKARNQG